MDILFACTMDQLIAISQPIIGLLQLVAIIFIGIWTIKTYHRITEISKNATIEAARLNDKSNRFNKLNSDLDKIVEYSIQYPYFEDEEYPTKNYRSDLNSGDLIRREKALRYELFAIMNFNFIEDLYKYYNGNEEQMSDQTNFTEMIESHAEYWKYKIIEKNENGYKIIKPLVNRTLNIQQ